MAAASTGKRRTQARSMFLTAVEALALIRFLPYSRRVDREGSSENVFLSDSVFMGANYTGALPGLKHFFAIMIKNQPPVIGMSVPAPYNDCIQRMIMPCWPC
jgi:hypothetical protein